MIIRKILLIVFAFTACHAGACHAAPSRNAKKGTPSISADLAGSGNRSITVSSSLRSSTREPTKISDLQPPPWPLPPLTSAEREARLEFVIKTQNYTVAKTREPMTQKFCHSLLDKLKDPATVHILEPTIVAQSRSDPHVPDNLIERCSSNVGIDRVWYTHKRGPLMQGGDTEDPVFAALSLEEKDRAADFYGRKIGPIEFYDVSRFFGGKKTWATFAEAGIFVCNNSADRLCKAQEGYGLSSNTIVGPVVDSESCAMHLLPRVKAGGRFSTSNAKPYAFRELPNFYAYAEIDNDLYRVGLSGAIPWGDFDRLMNGGATTLIAERANGDGGLCLYQTQKQKKGR